MKCSIYHIDINSIILIVSIHFVEAQDPQQDVDEIGCSKSAANEQSPLPVQMQPLQFMRSRKLPHQYLLNKGCKWKANI